MGQRTWSWIVPDGLWEIARPLIPADRVRPQGGGKQNTPDETLFAAIIYVDGAPARFMIWSRAGTWGRLREAVVHRLDEAGLVDVSRVVLDSAHVRAKNGANTQV